MENEKKEFDWGAVLTAFGLGFPIYVALAPKWFRKELVEYTGKWVAFLIAIGAVYLIWGRIKDKRKK